MRFIGQITVLVLEDFRPSSSRARYRREAELERKFSNLIRHRVMSTWTEHHGPSLTDGEAFRATLVQRVILFLRGTFALRKRRRCDLLLALAFRCRRLESNETRVSEFATGGLKQGSVRRPKVYELSDVSFASVWVAQT